MVVPEAAWNQNYKYFERIGADNVLFVSPGAIVMMTVNAEAIHQITSRRENFPKNTRDYKILEVFGRNVVTTEGLLWRMHRKVTSASFNEKNTALVWDETIRQTQGLIRHWMRGDMGNESTETLPNIDQDTMAVALKIIGYVGFGLKLLWPGEEIPADMDPEIAKFARRDPPPGHTMSFIESLEQTLEKIFLKLLVPKFLLKNLPFQATKVAYDATENFSNYMKELLKYKQRAIQAGDGGEPGMDIMGQLVHTQYGREKSSGKGKKEQIKLDDQEIIGNAFIMILAGHETTANSLHFVMLELAMHPESQRALQRDVDAIFGRDSDPLTWEYEENVGPLLGSTVGASMNELMRVIPSVLEVPKMVSPDRDQPLMIDGKKHILPKGMSIGLIVPGVQRNPRYWPKGDKNAEEHDANKFNPSRWIQQPDAKTKADEEDSDSAPAEDWGGYQGPDSSPSLFRPVRGSYIPFSDGARSCLGRRIAQVEVVAALSVISQNYSVELAVDEWATDEEVAVMTKDQRRELYKRAIKEADDTILTASQLITLKLRQKHVPVRLVKRGCERFLNDL
ncbi:hypothetical protein MKZ38_005169 [Zalerion maritima]|uniref:Cytochrome P450 n=1 Tax=Zalerion maritima TaxID=339359 RepID=A0AAD5RWA0_9PEZI|nr:hypothetical protein MKZ38_005169 [Zalerion maritima]